MSINLSYIIYMSIELLEVLLLMHHSTFLKLYYSLLYYSSFFWRSFQVNGLIQSTNFSWIFVDTFPALFLGYVNTGVHFWYPSRQFESSSTLKSTSNTIWSSIWKVVLYLISDKVDDFCLLPYQQNYIIETWE